jgi:hypothetical protein
VTSPQIINAIDAVLEGVEFTAPVTVEDVAIVHARIRAMIPDACSLDSYHRNVEVIFTATIGGEVLVRREKPVLP